MKRTITIELTLEDISTIVAATASYRYLLMKHGASVAAALGVIATYEGVPEPARDEAALVDFLERVTNQAAQATMEMGAGDASRH